MVASREGSAEMDPTGTPSHDEAFDGWLTPAEWREAMLSTVDDGEPLAP